MKGLKIAVIGAGSTYMPELIDGFVKRKNELPVKSFYLMDINRTKLEIVGGLAKRILDANDLKVEVVFTEDLEEALKDADYVITQIRVGMLDARITDEKIPLKYDLIGQETTGVGGFFKALRTIPEIMKIAKLMEKYCPEAWLINFTNPSGLITEAVLNNTSVKAVGLCNAPIYFRKKVIDTIAGPSADLHIEFVGLNHFNWVTGIYINGVEVLQPKIRGSEDISYLVDHLKNTGIDEELVRTVGGIPSGYLQYYYNREAKLRQLKEQKKTRGEECKEIEAETLRLYQDTGLREKPAILDKRGGAMYSEAAVSLISAIYNDKKEEHTVNVKNCGALEFLGMDDVVEISCVVGKNEITPIPVRNFRNEHIKGMIGTVKTYERHAVRAGLYGDYNEALRALLIHPLVGDYYKAKSVLDEMLAVNRKYLPQFNFESTASGDFTDK